MVKPLHTVEWIDDIERDKREIMGPISWIRPNEETINENDTKTKPMGEGKQDFNRDGNGACIQHGRCITIRCHDCQ